MSDLERLELVLRRMLAAKEYRADIKELLLDMVEALNAYALTSAQHKD